MSQTLAREKKYVHLTYIHITHIIWISAKKKFAQCNVEIFEIPLLLRVLFDVAKRSFGWWEGGGAGFREGGGGREYSLIAKLLPKLF